MTPTTAEIDRATGRQRRKDSCPRSALGTLTASNRSALDILSEQNDGRLADLVPLRFARMLIDPFTFYRGSAAVMAADLACSPSSGINVLACGDAHVSNFGLYASPQRDLVFDLNDFDEAAAAPWEWDLKRLVTSAVVGGRHAGHRADLVDAYARATAASYVTAMQQMMRLDALDRYYLHLQPELLTDRLDPSVQQLLDRTARRARGRTSERVVRKLTELDANGRHVLRENPPVLTRPPRSRIDRVAADFTSYLATVSPDVALLLSQFELNDVGRRVVGVGSVGTRCYLLVLTGPQREPLVLQIKEAVVSVLERYGQVAIPGLLADKVAARGQGGRVVGAQRSLQAVSDPFLGYFRSGGHDYYVRQFHDMKGSVDLDATDATSFGEYARSCAVLLARAHTQSPRASMVQGYIGKGGQIVDAIVRFAHAYADKNQHDFDELTAAARDGRVEVSADPAR